MALIKNIILEGTNVFKTQNVSFITDKKTLILENVYIKVENLETTKEKGFISVLFKNNIATWSKSYEIVFDILSNDNFIKQAYLYLKTLPEFADAEDC